MLSLVQFRSIGTGTGTVTTESNCFTWKTILTHLLSHCFFFFFYLAQLSSIQFRSNHSTHFSLVLAHEQNAINIVIDSL